MDEEKLALVLSGGGAKGAYEVGVLRALLRLDITPELICGSSIGALNGAIFAEAVEQDRVDEFLDWLTCLWLGERHLFPFNWRGLWQTICLCKMPIRMPSLFSTRRIKNLLSRVIPRTRTTSGYQKIEVAFTGTDLNDAILRVFDRSCAASVLDVVTASLSLPVILSAAKIGCHHFVDGGLLSNTPIMAAIQRGATRVIVVSLRPLSPLVYSMGMADQGPYDDLVSVAERVITLVLDRVMYQDLEEAQRINQMLKIINETKDARTKEQLRQLCGPNLAYRPIDVMVIAPETVLHPPGTFGFDDKPAIIELLQMGEADALKVLMNVSL